MDDREKEEYYKWTVVKDNPILPNECSDLHPEHIHHVEITDLGNEWVRLLGWTLKLSFKGH